MYALVTNAETNEIVFIDEATFGDYEIQGEIAERHIDFAETIDCDYPRANVVVFDANGSVLYELAQR